MNIATIKTEMIRLSSLTTAQEVQADPKAREVFEAFIKALNAGAIRAAEPTKSGWQTNAWVKEGIVKVGFRLGALEVMTDADAPLQFSDKDTLPIQQTSDLSERNIRIVPGGSSVRAGSYLGHNVIMMPPAYVNIGAYVDDNSMVDSLALVGSCAQIGKNVHLAAGAIVGGVLEPANATPCIVGDGSFIGAYAGIFSGVRLGNGVVLAPKTVITEATEVWEALPGKAQRKLENSSAHPIVIPDRALVIPGSVQLKDADGNPSPLSKNVAIIRGYYEEGGNAKLALNEFLRAS